MPMRVAHRSLTKLSRVLTSGALALTVLGSGGGALPTSEPRPALAADVDCYNDKDPYDLPECVQQRATDAANGSQPTDSSQPGGDQAQSAGDQGQQQASNPPSQPPAPA